MPKLEKEVVGREVGEGGGGGTKETREKIDTRKMKGKENEELKRQVVRGARSHCS